MFVTQWLLLEPVKEDARFRRSARTHFSDPQLDHAADVSVVLNADSHWSPLS